MTNIERVEEALKDGPIPAWLEDLEGMSGTRIRRFLSTLNAKRLLEVGCWKGSTFAASCQSPVLESATTIDSYVHFNGEEARRVSREVCEQHLVGKNWNIVEGNIYMLPYQTIPDNIDTFFYDGDHTPEATRRAIIVAFPHMAEDFVMVFDDANFRLVVEAAKRGLADCGAVIHKEWRLGEDVLEDKDGWWNGLYVIAGSKPKLPKCSAVCLTYDMPTRLSVINRSVECFLRQTVSDKEMVIVVDDPGIQLLFNHPQVKVVYSEQRCESLGHKYNLGCEQATGTVLLSWDDDDISLPLRMYQSARNIKNTKRKAVYHNPRAYYFLNGGHLQHEVKTGYAHNAAAFTKRAWELVGGYQAMNGPQDAQMDQDLRAHKLVTVVETDGSTEYSQYIYCWGDGQQHISGHSDTDKAYADNASRSVRGSYQITPRWPQDYVYMTRALTKLDRWDAPIEEKIASMMRVPARSAEPKTAPILTIGMAHRDDYQGIWATLGSWRLYHREVLEHVEFVVVNNSPRHSRHNKSTKQFTEARPNCRFIDYTEKTGTAAAKQQVYENAQGKAVLLTDCHVMMGPGVGRQILDFVEELDSNKEVGRLDLFHGPIMGDAGRDDDLVGTEFAPSWGTYMHGQWHTNQVAYKLGKPFTIWGSGCGMMLCLREAWLNFSPHMRGFGGEEGYIHQKFRNAGRQVWCLPWMRWLHRFGNMNGTSYPVPDRAFNYYISHYDVGSPTLEEIKECFKDDINDIMLKRLNREARMFFGERERSPIHALVEANFLKPDPGIQQWETEYLNNPIFNCPHREDRQGAVMCNVGCPSMRSEPVSVFGCKLYDLVTLGKRRTDLHQCMGCSALPVTSQMVRAQRLDNLLTQRTE